MALVKAASQIPSMAGSPGAMPTPQYMLCSDFVPLALATQRSNSRALWSTTIAVSALRQE